MDDDRPDFKVDDRVEWSSVANGSRTIRRGTIVAVVPAGHFWEYCLQPGFFMDYQVICKRVLPTPRKETSYLVSVPDGNRKPRLYWPRTRGLRKIGE